MIAALLGRSASHVPSAEVRPIWMMYTEEAGITSASDGVGAGRGDRVDNDGDGDGGGGGGGGGVGKAVCVTLSVAWEGAAVGAGSGKAVVWIGIDPAVEDGVGDGEGVPVAGPVVPMAGVDMGIGDGS